jgi:hypothetical protein
MKKYDYDNNEMSTASEPAWTYGSSAMQMPTTDETNNDMSWLTPEIMKMIDQRVEKIENGTTKLIPHEKAMQWLEQKAELRKQERLMYANS